MNWQAYRKAILAFLSLVATNAAASLMQSGEPWPTTWGAWVRWAITTTAGTWLVYQVRNAPLAAPEAPPD